MSEWFELAREGIARALCAAFQMTWNSTDTLSFIRYAYDENDPSPQPGNNVNVCYITLTVADDAATSWASTECKNGRASVRKTIPLSCLFSFYGPDCLENAEKAWTGLMLDTGPDSPRGILRRFSITPVARPGRPNPLNEEAGGTWRLRTDMRMRLNLLRTDVYTFQPIEVSPEVELKV